MLKIPQIQLFLVMFVSVTLVSLTTYANDSYGLIDSGKGLIYIVNVLSTIIYAAIMAVLDSRIEIKEHWSRVGYRFFLLTLIPGILAIQHANYLLLSLAFMNYTIFYFLFELIYDVEKNHRPYSVGTTAWNDRIVNWLNAKTFLGKIFPGWYIGLKVVLIVLAQYLVIKNFF
jgi:hypothetical protein